MGVKARLEMKQTAVFVLGILILIGQVFCARNVSKATQFGEDYVFNGMKVGRISEYPWVAFFKGLGCTGAVISKKFILTAAHCFKDKENDKIQKSLLDNLMRRVVFVTYSAVELIRSLLRSSTKKQKKMILPLLK